jgi:predicted regulator of Ras-like GTPase activity (Roadblock/LC7/MglB family)
MRFILLELNEKSVHIEASAIISKDGLVITAVIPKEMNEDTIGAISAALYSVGSRSIHELGGSMEQIMVRGSQGYILMTHAGKETMLVVITKTHEELEPIFLELKQTAEKILTHLLKTTG